MASARKYAKWKQSLRENLDKANDDSQIDLFVQDNQPHSMPSKNQDDHESKSLLKQRRAKNVDSQGRDYMDELEKKGNGRNTALKNHRAKEDYFQTQTPSYYKPNKSKEEPLLMTSQKFQYGPGRFRVNQTAQGAEHQSKLTPDSVIWQNGKPNWANVKVNARVRDNYRKFVSLELFALGKFSLRFNRFYCEELKTCLKTMNCRFLMDFRAWLVDIDYYSRMLFIVRQYCDPKQIHVEEIPKFSLNLLLNPIPWSGTEHEPGGICFNYTDDKYVSSNVDELPKCIGDKLLLHQKKGIKKTLLRNGRIILNDDLGTGKKLIAISASIVYKKEWPLLIVCPQIMSQLWREEFVKWIPNFDLSKIQIVKHANEEFRQNAVIFIVAYQLLWQSDVMSKFDAKGFKVCIVDEATFLKQKNSPWNEVLVPFFSNMKRIMLLTGCQLTQNPLEIHSLVKIVRPDCIPDFLKFCNRFCDPDKQKDGIQYMGPSFVQELELLYRKRLAIRRTRDSQRVLVDMVKIQRKKVQTFGNPAVVEQVRKMILGSCFQDFEEKNPNYSVFQELLLVKRKNFAISPLQGEERIKLVKAFKTAYLRTGLAKLPQLIELIDILLENRISFVVTAYHQIIVDALEAALEKRKISFINISPFFARGPDQRENQQTIVDELSEFGALYDQETGQRNPGHLIVGILNYCDFTSNFKRVKKQPMFERLSHHLSKVFEGVIFGELHWKTDVIDQVEQLVLQSDSQQREIETSEATVSSEHFIRNIYYLKCSATMDEFLLSLLYHQNSKLWREIEPLESTRVKEKSKHEILKISSKTAQSEKETPEAMKLGLQGATFVQKPNNPQNSQFSQSHEFTLPMTANFFDLQSNKLKKSGQVSSGPIAFSQICRNLKTQQTQTDLPQDDQMQVEISSDSNSDGEEYSQDRVDRSQIGKAGDRGINETQTSLYGDNVHAVLNIHTQAFSQLSGRGPSQTQKSVATIKSLSASQFKDSQVSNISKLSALNPEESSQKLLKHKPAQKTLFDFKKAGFGMLKYTE